MDSDLEFDNPSKAASAIVAEIRALPTRNTATMRDVRCKHSNQLRQANLEFMFEIANILITDFSLRWLAYELLANHPVSFQRIGMAELEELGQGIDSWWTVDAFARTLSGPIWLRGQVPDYLIERWACSKDRWWWRAALVSTVALNSRSHGGRGEVVRTLRICTLLVRNHDDMVAKAMSWALRELVVHDADAVREFIIEHENDLAALVKREVRNKLATGLKNPGRQEYKSGVK
jgi:3-methyladenine DNA glycosylase AlkD